MSKAVALASSRYLDTALQIDTAQLKDLQGQDYRNKLHQSIWLMLNDPNPTNDSKCGYKIASTALSMAHVKLVGDTQFNRDVQKVIDEIWHAFPQPMASPRVEQIVATYCKWYEDSTMLNCFTDTGEELGRAQTAFVKSVKELVLASTEPQSVRDETSATLRELNALAKAIGSKLLKRS